jgi:hypothetical protein
MMILPYPVLGGSHGNPLGTRRAALGRALWKHRIRVASMPTLIPRCPRILAELCNDQVPVEVIADEHQFGHRARRVGVMVLAVVLGRSCRLHSAGDAGPDSLYQQMPGSIAHMGEALDAQHRFLGRDAVECLVEGVRGLGGLAAQDKREPAGSSACTCSCVSRPLSTGSPKVLTPLTSRRPRRCSKRSPDSRLSDINGTIPVAKTV